MGRRRIASLASLYPVTASYLTVVVVLTALLAGR